MEAWWKKKLPLGKSLAERWIARSHSLANQLTANESATQHKTTQHRAEQGQVNVAPNSNHLAFDWEPFEQSSFIECPACVQKWL